VRVVAWNCNMALHRKAEALLALRPDVAVISECAEPPRLRGRSDVDWIEAEPVWVGNNPNKGLAVFGFNGYRARLMPEYAAYLRYIVPVRVEGPSVFNLLAVWAQIAAAGTNRKHQLGPLRRAIARYREFLAETPCFIAGDWNNNVFWDKPGWRTNHRGTVDSLERLGLVSAYHEVRGEAQGAETIPTLYWRDRRKDGPTYHIDYIFLSRALLPRIGHFEVGGFEAWCGNGLSDHVPLLVEIEDLQGYSCSAL